MKGGMKWTVDMEGPALGGGGCHGLRHAATGSYVG